MKTKSNVELEPSHHDDFASDSFAKFMELWKNGREAALNINCKDGKAWIQISWVSKKRKILLPRKSQASQILPK